MVVNQVERYTPTYCHAALFSYTVQCNGGGVSYVICPVMAALMCWGAMCWYVEAGGWVCDGEAGEMDGWMAGSCQ